MTLRRRLSPGLPFSETRPADGVMLSNGRLDRSLWTRRPDDQPPAMPNPFGTDDACALRRAATRPSRAVVQHASGVLALASHDFALMRIFCWAYATNEASRRASADNASASAAAHASSRRLQAGSLLPRGRRRRRNASNTVHLSRCVRQKPTRVALAAAADIGIVQRTCAQRTGSRSPPPARTGGQRKNRDAGGPAG